MNKLSIKKLGVLSVAKMYGAISLVVSIFISVPYGLIAILWWRPSMVTNENAGIGSGGGILVGLAIMIGLPVFYSIMGFVGGALGAVLYNVFSNFVGGIEIEVENIA